jgi:predicted ATPase
MITLVEALNYRCLRYVHRPLKPFHVLVGPNASGKTTFLDVIGFLSDLVSEGLDTAVLERSHNPEELLFQRQGDRFELAVEARIPATRRELTSRPEMDTVRYELAIGFDDAGRWFEFKGEQLLLKKTESLESRKRSSFPKPSSAQDSLLTNIRRRDNKVIISKSRSGNDNFYSEASGRLGKGWGPSFRLGPQKSAFGNMMPDETLFPVAAWFRHFIVAGVQRFALTSRVAKQPSPPTRIAGFLPDGTNLPWVVARLRNQAPERYQYWISHLQTALPELVDIATFERPEDRHCYMIYEYADGLKVPSWLVSDGTLRLTALTLPAYMPDLRGIYLIEEPENGIHPSAVSTACDSLRSMYEAQVLLATHSPVVLNEADMSDVLCFAKDEYGATDIVQGSEHPALRQWRGGVDSGTLLASGVLG